MNTADLMIVTKDHHVVTGANLTMIVRMIGLIMIEDTKEDMTVHMTGHMTELMIEIDDHLHLPDMNLIRDHVLPINCFSLLDCLIIWIFSRILIIRKSLAFTILIVF